MKVFQTIAGIDKESGGPSYTVPAVCSNLNALGVDVELNLLSSFNKGNRIGSTDFAICIHDRSFPSKLGASSDMRTHLLSQGKKGDVFHTHGLWLMPNIYPYKISKAIGAKFVLSPEGMLTSWSLNRSKIKKGIVGVLGQYEAIRNADCIHVTAESEYEDVRNFGYSGPIAIIPNGIDIPEYYSARAESSGKAFKKLIFISRIHPKKGIELLLEAWSKIHHIHSEWELEICGPGELDYINKIKKLIDSIPDSRARYLPPIYDNEKQLFYDQADLFVLPTHSENFGVVVAEALSNEIPVIVTKGAPWSGVIEHDCGWWINNTLEELVNTLNTALTLPSQSLSDMGKRGRVWMEKDFSWKTISENMLSTYNWLYTKVDKPDFVRLG